MAIFGGRKSSDETPKIDPTVPTPPAEDERFTKMQEQISGLTDVVSKFVEASAQQYQQPKYVQQQAPQLPAIQDISEEEFDAALDEGGAAAKKAIKIRQAAEQERLRREFSAQLGAVQGPGMAAINDLTIKSLLRDNELYKTDTAIKKDVDMQLGQIKQQGMLITEEAVQWVVQKVIGEHTPRLLKEDREKFTRQLREEQTTPERGRKAGREVQQDRRNEIRQPDDVSPDAEQLLQSRNHGRGQTADDFARTLPRRTIVDKSGQRTRLGYENWDDMMTKYNEARDEYEHEQLPAYFGGNK